MNAVSLENKTILVTGLAAVSSSAFAAPVSYTHLTLPTNSLV